jgi:hypothetical protein
MQSKLMMTICLSSCSLLFTQLAQAQFCGLSNSSLTGSYGYVASEAGTVTTTSSGTGTTGTTGTTTGSSGSTTANTYSTTNIGQLLGGISAGNQFAFSGVLTFDGAGNITSTSAPTGTAVAQIGTYNVNSDCSISVSLSDVFGTNTTATQLVGVILGRGSEIDLTSTATLQSQTGTSSTSTTSTGSGSSTTSNTQPASGLAIKLVHVLYQNGCSDSTLTGLYGFVLNPTAMQTQSTSTGTTTTSTGTTTGTGTTTTTTGTTSTTSPLSAVIGYLDFSGSGQIVAPADSSGISSSVPAATPSLFAFTGTYSVNPDCSGTMTISSSSTSSSTGTTTGNSSTSQSITVSFVITPPAGPSTGPEISIGFSTPDQSGTGYALSQ